MFGVLASASNSDAIKTIFTSALGSVQTDVFAIIGIALPVGLGIVGAVIAVRLGIKFFKGVTGS